MQQDASATAGLCQACGIAAGTLQHAPAPAPVTGIWCARCYGKLARRGQWLHMLYRYRFFVVFALVMLFVLGQKAMAQEFTKAAQCVVGTRVVNRDGQAGVIASADGSSCRVKLDATGKIDYNIFWMLRPEGGTGKGSGRAGATAAPSTSAPGSGGLVAGLYKCYMLAGTTLNYAFIDIRIEDNSRYRDKSGKAGTWKLADGGKIVFTGPLAAANARLLPGPRIGLNMDGGGFFNTSCSIGR